MKEWHEKGKQHMTPATSSASPSPAHARELITSGVVTSRDGTTIGYRQLGQAHATGTTDAQRASSGPVQPSNTWLAAQSPGAIPAKTGPLLWLSRQWQRRPTPYSHLRLFFARIVVVPP
jgi:hypothetical protein